MSAVAGGYFLAVVVDGDTYYFRPRPRWRTLYNPELGLELELWEMDGRLQWKASSKRVRRIAATPDEAVAQAMDAAVARRKR